MRNDITLFEKSITAESSCFADDFYESTFFTGNGRMGARGYIPFEPSARPIQTGLFIAGVFDEIKSGITDFVNLPTPIWEQIKMDGKSPTLAAPIKRTLDFSCGVLSFEYVLAVGEKHLNVLHQRFFSMSQTSLLLQRTICIPQTEMHVTIESGIHTACCNCPIPDDQVKENSETIQLTMEKGTHFYDNGFTSNFATHVTNISLEQQISFRPQGFGKGVSFHRAGDAVGMSFDVDAAKNQTLFIEKVAALFTSRDKDPLITPLSSGWSFDGLLEQEKVWWQNKWQLCGIEIQGDAQTQAALHYCIYQLIVNCSARDDTVNIGARGLTHTRYKGCYFWDTDLFMMPFYLLTDPSAAKNLMQFRINTLPQAKANAAKMNNAGARYPWMVSYDGTEQCESWDIGASEVHITADIVYAMNQYVTATLDEEFYKNGAAEVYIETARFWLSRYTPEPNTDKVNLLFCKGPDEYCGITSNNLFTNVMVQHNLKLATRAAEYLRQNNFGQYQKLGISEDEIQTWERLHHAIKLPQDPVTKHWRTDDTFHLLEPVDLSTIKPDAGASYHHVCFDRLQRYKVIKQADVLLLMSRLPEKFTAQEKLNAWEDFEPLCLHDSTLSFASHALFAAQNGLVEPAEHYFEQALYLDLKEVMGNTGKEGLHLACLGETWQVVVFGFAGLSFADGSPKLHPHLPDSWTSLKFNFIWENKTYCAKISADGASITSW